jgi:hypothetical protein
VRVFPSSLAVTVWESWIRSRKTGSYIDICIFLYYTSLKYSWQVNKWMTDLYFRKKGPNWTEIKLSTCFLARQKQLTGTKWKLTPPDSFYNIRYNLSRFMIHIRSWLWYFWHCTILRYSQVQESRLGKKTKFLLWTRSILRFGFSLLVHYIYINMNFSCIPTCVILIKLQESHLYPFTIIMPMFFGK